MTTAQILGVSTDHSLGPVDAPITLIEYGSYDCRHCIQVLPILAEILRKYGTGIRFIYRHFPRQEPHSPSQRAAIAAEAAGRQGKFWQMHEHLLHHQDALDEASLLAYASIQGLNVRQFTLDLRAQAVADSVRAQFNTGIDAGVRSTPTFIVNGQRHDGDWDADSLLSAIRRAAWIQERDEADHIRRVEPSHAPDMAACV